MLTDKEWNEIYPLMKLDLEQMKTYRIDTGDSVREANIQLNSNALVRYFEITGFREIGRASCRERVYCVV